MSTFVKADGSIGYRYEWEDKAGGYGIQTAFGAKFISRIEGDYYNVVGLPVSHLYMTLRELGLIEE
jgi:septum formation protein